MGGAICRICCNRPAESGDALDSMGKPWPYKQTEDLQNGDQILGRLMEKRLFDMINHGMEWIQVLRQHHLCSSGSERPLTF